MRARLQLQEVRLEVEALFLDRALRGVNAFAEEQECRYGELLMEERRLIDLIAAQAGRPARAAQRRRVA